MNNALQMPQHEERLALVNLVLERVLSGLTLKRALEGTGKTAHAFLHIVSSVRELGALYVRAMEHRADLWNEQIVEIANDPDIDPHRAKVIIDALKWTAAKAHPKKYADRIDVNVSQTISVLDARNEARARLIRPVSDQDVIDVLPRPAEHVDMSSLAAPAAAAPAPGEPDIFS